MRKWLWYLWKNEDGFFGIGMGPSQQESQEFGNIANIGNFATSTGEGDIALASNFWKDILSGDPTKISKVLGPQLSGMNKRAQQEEKTASEFGNRGGGTNAVMQSIGDTTRSSADALISNLTSTAAGTLGSMGEGLLGTGLSADTSAFSAAKTIHDQKAAKIGDIFKSIADIASSFVPGGGLSSLFKKGSGGGFDTGVPGGDNTVFG